MGELTELVPHYLVFQRVSNKSANARLDIVADIRSKFLPHLDAGSRTLLNEQRKPWFGLVLHSHYMVPHYEKKNPLEGEESADGAGKGTIPGSWMPHHGGG